MARNSNIKVSSLDFDGIKNNLKDYLKSQNTFKDYNFEGSSLSILLDLLAYNTHYTGFYNNMVANEMFLDSAVKRGSIVSLAKQLGYQAGSSTCARSEIDIVLSNPSSSSVIPRGTKFTATLGGVSYQFVNLKTYTVESGADVTSSDTPHITGVVIYEGALMSQTFINDDSAPDQAFILPQRNVDKTTIEIRVQKSTADTEGYSDEWKEAVDITTIDGSSKTFRVSENPDGKYQIRFGDGVLGKKLDHGNVVTVEYMITTGPNANGIGASDSSSNRVFSSSSSAISEVRVVSFAQGGSFKEQMDSIRFNAPMFFASQNRAVTAADYKAIIQKEFPSIASLNVYGGETSTPPQYGRVLIAVKPNTGTRITRNTRKEIESLVLNSKGVVAIDAKVIDPTYLYIKMKSIIEVDTDATVLSTDEVVTLVKNRLISYANEDLERFERGLRSSHISEIINGVDQGVLGNRTSVEMEYRLEPNIGTNSTYQISLSNAISHPHEGHMPVIRSSEFTYLDSASITRNGILEDDGYSSIVLKRKNASGFFEKDTDIGSVDYKNGIISLDRINFSGTGLFPEVRISIEPEQQDIISTGNIILILDERDGSTLDITAYSSPGGRFVGVSPEQTTTKTRTSITGDITPDVSGGLGGGGISSY